MSFQVITGKLASNYRLIVKWSQVNTKQLLVKWQVITGQIPNNEVSEKCYMLLKWLHPILLPRESLHR